MKVDVNKMEVVDSEDFHGFSSVRGGWHNCREYRVLIFLEVKRGSIDDAGIVVSGDAIDKSGASY
jgi:hypothetical protein